MSEFAARRPKRPPTHPGAILRDIVIPGLKISVSKAAQELDVARQVLHGILAGRIAVSAEMALKLGRWCGNGPDVWLAMQREVDLWDAKSRIGATLKRIPEHKVDLAA